MSLDLSKIKRVYFIGIKGVAMSGLAVICKQRGMEVSGSDVSDKFITDKILDDHGIEVFEEFLPDHLDDAPNLVVVGASWDDSNVEVAAAYSKGLLVITDSEMRGILSREKSTIAVTGVHGKTTTTAMLAFLFSQAGQDPSYLIGTGKIPDLDGNATWRQEGKHFIVEGDEYIRSHQDHTPKFLDLSPDISIITSIEWEHVDVYKNVEALEQVFLKLIEKTKSKIIACGDWPSVQKIITNFKNKTITYGLEHENDYQAYDIITESKHTKFKVRHGGEELGEFTIKLFGPHNTLNALATIITAIESGIEIGRIRDIIRNFKGAERRFDVSERNGIIFIDDYAHHPTEIDTTLKAIRHRYKDKKIWCVFQPHMASRTKAFLDELAQSFSAADLVMFPDIFSSAREEDEDISSKNLEEKARVYHQHTLYTGDLDQTIDYLKNKLTPDIILVTMGAGDVYRVRDKIISEHL